MNRREFLATAMVPFGAMASPRFRARRPKEFRVDVVIAGGGVGGCAAALAVCRQGLTAVMIEPTDWVGGQLTSQAVPPDEHPWIESFGCTAAYRAFRNGVRAHYRDTYPLTAVASQTIELNPGAGWVSRLCCEPKASLAVLQRMLQPYIANGSLTVLLRHRLVAAEVERDHVKAVEVEGEESSENTVLRAALFLDATELGDLLPLTHTEHAVGAESRSETGEPNAPITADSLDQQAITWCFALEHREGEDHTVSRPAEYTFWRDYIPKMQPAWPGRLLAWETSDPVTLKPRGLGFDPINESTPKNLWTYRRVRASRHFTNPKQWPDVSLVNWPQNDYWLGPLVGVSASTVARHLKRARQLSLSLLYWMQTAAPRPDGGTGWRGLRLASETTQGPDGLAKAAYIRESRRIKAEFSITENHVGGAARKALLPPGERLHAAVFEDSVGVGAYRLDLHPSTRGRNYVDLQSLPFQIPLGALIPRRVENLVAAGKCLGTTHITNGCYRLHPVEWNIGEAAGELAVFCASRLVPPRQVWKDLNLRGEYQAQLLRAGFELEWPDSVRPL